MLATAGRSEARKRDGRFAGAIRRGLEALIHDGSRFMLGQLVEALIHNIMIAGVIVAGILVAAVIYAVRNRAAAADAYQRLDGESPPSILLLGPSDAGKTTLHRAGLALAGEQNSNEPQTSTRGLVRRLLLLPTGDNNFRRRVLLCDAGGGRDELA